MAVQDADEGPDRELSEMEKLQLDIETEIKAYEMSESDLDEEIRSQKIIAQQFEALARDPGVKDRIENPEVGYSFQPDIRPIHFDPRQLENMNVNKNLPPITLTLINAFSEGNRLRMNIMASNNTSKQGNKTISIWTFDETGRLVESQSKSQYFRANQKIFLQYRFQNSPSNARWIIRVSD